MTTDFTKEWIQQQIAEMESARDEIPFGLGVDGDNTIAAFKLALAGMEQEPVAEVYQPANIGICAALGPSIRMLRPLDPGMRLYAAPQLPQPEPVADETRRIRDLVMMVKILCRTVGKYNPDSQQAKNFTAYLQREGLISSNDCLRTGLRIPNENH